MNEREDVIRTREAIMEAVRQAMAERQDVLEMAQLRVAFQECQGKLTKMEQDMATLHQTMLAYQAASQLRAEKLEWSMDKIAALTTEIALLRSAKLNEDGGHG